MEHMAYKIELVKSELAFHGIRVTEDGHCYSFMEGEDDPTQSTVPEKISEIKYEIEENKRATIKFYMEVCKLLKQHQNGVAGGTTVTESMFASALKNLFRFAKYYKYFGKTAEIFKEALSLDSNKFTESTMSQVIDYKICIDWMHHLVRNGSFVSNMLDLYQSNMSKNVTAQNQMVGPTDYPIKERAWEWDKDREDFEESEKNNRQQTRFLGGNDAEWLSEGFTWTDPQQEPFLFGDEENDPYNGKHFYNFKSKIHRGVDQ